MIMTADMVKAIGETMAALEKGLGAINKPLPVPPWSIPVTEKRRPR